MSRFSRFYQSWLLIRRGHKKAFWENVLLNEEWSNRVELIDILAQLVYGALFANLDNYNASIFKMDNTITFDASNILGSRDTSELNLRNVPDRLLKLPLVDGFSVILHGRAILSKSLRPTQTIFLDTCKDGPRTSLFWGQVSA